MNRVLDFMGKDHDRLDKIFKEFKKIKNKDFDKVKSLFSQFKTGLQRHIVWEEEILFILFEERTGLVDGGPTEVMRMEHRQIKKFLHEIHEKIERQDTQTDNLEYGLVEVLTNHNYKEENILYPWIDKELNEEEINDAFKKMSNLPSEKYENCCE